MPELYYPDHYTLFAMVKRWMKEHPDNLATITPYMELMNSIDEYRQLATNPALLEKLFATLEAEMAVKAIRAKIEEFDKTFNWVGRWWYRRVRADHVAILDELIEKRTKAHKSYEMLRKLSFGSDRGEILRLMFD